MSDYISQTITGSSSQSDISNQCRIKTPCITGITGTGGLGGGGRAFCFLALGFHLLPIARPMPMPAPVDAQASGVAPRSHPCLPCLRALSHL